MSKKIISMNVNGKKVEEAVESRTLLVHFLREKMNLTGAHIGCETSHCGACTVDIDGESVKSCTCFAVQCEGSERSSGRLLQRAWTSVWFLYPGHVDACLSFFA